MEISALRSASLCRRRTVLRASACMRLSNSRLNFSRIEAAAALVKVTISILSKGTPSRARDKILSTITVVLPLPAAALTSSPFPLASIALCCGLVQFTRSPPFSLLFRIFRLLFFQFQPGARLS